MRRGRTTRHEKEYNSSEDSLQGSGSVFHWCDKPEKETDPGYSKAPQAVAALWP
jgi:hypothetical protein